jgi:hypothetical protein
MQTKIPWIAADFTYARVQDNVQPLATVMATQYSIGHAEHVHRPIKLVVQCRRGHSIVQVLAIGQIRLQEIVAHSSNVLIIPMDVYDIKPEFVRAIQRLIGTVDSAYLEIKLLVWLE